MRTCEDFEGLLPAYVAGIAGPADAQEIGEHLGECEPCMNDFQQVVKDLGALKLWKEAALPEGLGAGILERIVDLAPGPERSTEPPEESWGQPLYGALRAAGLAAVVLVVGTLLLTSYAGTRYWRDQEMCAENLRRIGVAATSGGAMQIPLAEAMKELPKPLEKETFLCPVAGEFPPGHDSSYRLELPGPLYVAGDWRSNHRHHDANILLSDGSVIRVTPSQPTFWNLLDPLGPGR